MATSVASLAVPWMTLPPVAEVERKSSGRPVSSASQSSTRVSSSVAAGLVDQSMPCTPRPADSSSPSTAGPEAFAGKYAKKDGDCQCVSPGRMMSSRSLKMSSQPDSPASPSSGGCAGSFDATPPGATCERTGKDSSRA